MIDCSNMNDGCQGNYFNPCPFDGPIEHYCTHCNNMASGTMHSHRSGSNVKSNEATALSMTAQPFVPKQVMDIARPMPLNNTLSSRRNKESNNNKNNNNNGNNEFGTYKTMQQHLQGQPIPCTCFCSGPQLGGHHVETLLQEPMQQLTLGTPLQTERGRSIDPHRFSQILTPGLIFEGHGTFPNAYNGGGNANGSSNSHQRSRSAWRTNAQREMDNASPKNLQRNSFISQNIFTTLPSGINSANGTGQFQCINPGCSMHSMQQNVGNQNGMMTMMFPAGENGTCHRSRSYEFLDQANSMPVTMMGQRHQQQQHVSHHHPHHHGHQQGSNNYNNGMMMYQEMKAQQKASLPPASHHSPEQRTSYRQ